MTKRLIKLVLGPCNKEDSDRQISLQRLDNCPHDWTYDPQEYIPVINVNYNKNEKKIYAPSLEESFDPTRDIIPTQDTIDSLYALIRDLNCLIEQISLSPDNQETELELPKEVIEYWTNFANREYIERVVEGYLVSCTFNPNNSFYTPENERKKIIKAIKEASNIARIKMKGYKSDYKKHYPEGLKDLQIETGGNIPRCDMPPFTVNQFRDWKWE